MPSPVTTTPTLTVIHSNTNTDMPIHSSSVIVPLDNITDIHHNTGSEIQPINSHPMVTRAKVGIFKPKTYNAMVSIPTTPTFVKEAISSPMWFQAMNDEYHALLSNKTWTLTTLPSGASLVGCKWIFKTKLHADGTFQRCKARLVAKGFNQTEGVDYTETFSPVVKHNTIRIVLSHAVTHQWHVRQIDINNVFLHGDLIEHVYMQQPPGFASRDSTLVCRLHKAIYGLKQAPRSWFSKLSQTLIHLGFQSTVNDSSVFTKFTTSFTLFVFVYVDDIIITGSLSTTVTDLISTLSSFFALKDLGPLHHFLGIQVSTTQHGNMHLSQAQYIKELLRRTNMLHAKSQPTPVTSSLQQDSSEPFQDPSMYRSVVGALQYILITRPELSYSINRVCHFMHDPKLHHWQAVKRILRYLAGTSNFGLLLKRQSLSSIIGFSDADWGVDVDDRKSTTAYCIYIGSNLVSWSTHKQKSVSRSSTEAEYRVVASLLTEVIWTQSLLS